ncbi:hypothetical protein K461DRAFT_250879 [Myriangium duriaei CBS 260.36]|uniref:uS12 prolyl 3,4-dihydroxylase n=1 Tax=Myriangium duriaei CBS 260.36 TaxID=1168546 RepID=A0A9P4MLW2_9PEZI|nr:hypothetical protein K461DRAFT_250879 [Myriangium duriaei CBS 260.36]
MKRKIEEDAGAANGSPVKVARAIGSAGQDFHEGLLEDSTISKYRDSYAASGPYKHAVVQPLISDSLLRSVRQEIIDNIHFTPKETDIYRIFQSGDLANLDGLPEAALSKLPSLLRLRDALYSAEFRSWISTVSGAGPVSGKKTDMAINVYKPGCHLLCHDDVIGSRRVSYILYLTDPDTPWQSKWGGALRLYPTTLKDSADGRKLRVPDAHWTKVIPPAWNQLSFFAVQPGESFHDVEEVYRRAGGDPEADGGRVRMAISGWFHIPQEGEEGFEAGLEEKLAEQSSLQQLQAKNDALDLPQIRFVEPRPLTTDKSTGQKSGKDDGDDDVDEELTQQDLEFLLKYMSPHYLTPDTVEELAELFAEESSLQLANILSPKIITQLESQIMQLEHLEGHDERWSTASPPHKHRYLYTLPASTSSESDVAASQDLLGDILGNLLPSQSFHKWLSFVTDIKLGVVSNLGRRFRKGLDYTLATAHDDNDMQLEWCINLTPSKGWSKEVEEEDGEPETNGNRESSSKTKNDDQVNDRGETEGPSTEDDESGPGGYEMYMAGEDADDDDDDDDAGSDHGVTIPANAAQTSSSTTGGGHRRVLKTKSKGADPAIYKAAAEDEDDGILFMNQASWNTMSLVLRDKGTLRFVKYVSQNAPGDRWDIVGAAPVLNNDDEESEGEDDE